MRTRIPLLLSLCMTAAAFPLGLYAQGDDLARGSDIMRQLAARRAAIERMGRSLSATIHTTSIIRVDSEKSKVALVPSQVVVHESIGEYVDEADAGVRVRIGALRGSALPAGIGRNLLSNIESLGQYFSIEDEEIVILNTSLPSPLAADAGKWYSFALVGASSIGGEKVHEIEVRPLSTLYPGFTGRISVTEKDFDLARVDLRPSDATAFPFVRSLRLVQTFSPVGSSRAFRPESLEITGTAEVMAVAFGLVESQIAFEMKTLLSDRSVEGAIPDSMRRQIEPLVIATGADSMDARFWQSNGRLGAGEVQAIETSRAAASEKSGPVSFSFAPYIDYNRAGATTLGLTPGMTVGPINVSGTGAYSFGLARPVGDVTITSTHPIGSTFTAGLRASTFSHLATTTTGDKSYPRIMNTLVSATLHQDYYNFLRKDGWSGGVDFAFEPVRLALTYEQSRQFSVGNNARFALLTLNTKEFQENPPITDGEYTTMFGELSWGRVVPFLKITPAGSIDLRWSLSGLSGKRTDVDTSFNLVEGLLSLSIPVLSTGYNPMTLTLLGAGGKGSETLVPQYQFRLRTSAASFGKPGGFVSPPKGLYGGTEYIAVGAELNLTDFPWRAIGLPTYKGRGVELIVAGGAARYQQTHHTGYSGTGDLWYTEAGIALSRIPLYLTDLVAGRVDVRKGFGELGKIGANFTFVVPL